MALGNDVIVMHKQYKIAGAGRAVRGRIMAMAEWPWAPGRNAPVACTGFVDAFLRLARAPLSGVRLPRRTTFVGGRAFFWPFSRARPPTKHVRVASASASASLHGHPTLAKPVQGVALFY